MTPEEYEETPERPRSPMLKRRAGLRALILSGLVVGAAVIADENDCPTLTVGICDENGVCP